MLFLRKIKRKKKKKITKKKRKKKKEKRKREHMPTVGQKKILSHIHTLSTMELRCKCGQTYLNQSSLNRHKKSCVFGLVIIRRGKRKNPEHLQHEDRVPQGQEEQQEEDLSSIDEPRPLNRPVFEEKKAASKCNKFASSESSECISSQSNSDESESESESESGSESESESESKIESESESDDISEKENDSDIDEDDVYFGEEIAGGNEAPISNLVEDMERKEKKEYFPFPNKETALLYFWAHSNPRISKRKMQGLLYILHTPGFSLASVPKTSYHLQKYKKQLPKIKPSESS